MVEDLPKNFRGHLFPTILLRKSAGHLLARLFRVMLWSKECTQLHSLFQFVMNIES